MLVPSVPPHPPATEGAEIAQAPQKTGLDALDSIRLGLDSTDGPSDSSPKAGVDQDVNPRLDLSTTKHDLKLVDVPASVSVDWRDGKVKDCNATSQRRAAQAQRLATIAPVGEACTSCGKGDGPFASCRVLVLGGELWFGGACANCAFNAGGENCSIRECL